MWARDGWTLLRRGNAEPCWGSYDNGRRFWDGVLRGDSCNSNWYEGSIGWQSYDGDYPGVLGFDNEIASYCGRLSGAWGRRRRLDANASIDDNKNYSRRRLDSLGDARNCIASHHNILMLFGGNVHNTGAGYNSCRNLEWQMCAAMGKLPGQTTPTVIFAKAPKELDTTRHRPLGRCGGWAPKGCPPQGYSNDDIYFLEVCAYSMACKNNRELFTVNAEEPFHCEVDETGFKRMRDYLLEAAKSLTQRTGR